MTTSLRRLLEFLRLLQPRQSRLLRERQRFLAFLPLPHGARRDIQQHGSLSLCQAEPRTL